MSRVSLVAIVWLFAGLIASAPALAEGVASALTGNEGHFVVDIKSQVAPVPLNELHTWAVTVTTPDGTPVTGATIGVSGGMPEHNHGLPTAPRVTAETGEGSYRLEGMKFQMPGHWIVNMDIEADGIEDTVMVELDL